jgi:hypothetical protein
MIPIINFFLTVENGKKLTGTIESYQYDKEDIFRFLFDNNSQSFEILKREGCWIYKSGITDYLDSWVEELGQQIDTANKIEK